MSDAIKLEPCPFCGGAASMAAPNMHRKTSIHCPQCGVSSTWGDPEKVAAWWNRRAEKKPLDHVGMMEFFVENGDTKAEYVALVNMEKITTKEQATNIIHTIIHTEGINAYSDSPYVAVVTKAQYEELFLNQP